MTVHHHPSDELLTAFAGGTLDLGQHIAVATHLVGCPRCRTVVHAMEHVGGAVLADMPRSEMLPGSFEALERRLGEPIAANRPLPELPRRGFGDVGGLPPFLYGYPDSSWRWIAPKVHLRPIRLPQPSPTRVFLLRSSPGTKMIEHTHSGFEMTCVLSGSFTHAGGHFGPGDFDFGDGSVDHDVIIDSTDDCVCLVAMQGDLKLSGLIGRLLQPLIRM
ncbi:cupin domain-containing protein [Bradyrhizobium jicamae]|uniref:Cupin domain-containing protein n=1 Tax=Bradyrhizobium jicamae TaxID=280332 RepID=A0ABS5FL86_9BRAD|nr:ChrR family anti-sigma-E factor [Bradyrhizobium jicamae]MBR0797548.1 cupin domain-containing protein [Bradyrhizobium jicamae]MBR0937792.1 cupin domain-containing protein [Bradyrhizobium jicamae]